MLSQVIFSIASSVRSVAPVAIAVGIFLVLLAIAWLLRTERKGRPSNQPAGAGSRAEPPASVWTWLVPLLLLIAAGAVLRLVGIGEKSLNHMEVYIPGIPLPAGISEPPPRHDWYAALSWGFFTEPHPVGYYLAMFGWTKLFGTSVAALRLPAALFGILSIPVVYRLGRLTYGRTAGLIAAAFITFHGFHIHTSTWARMFVPESFVGLVATWLLLEILRSSQRRGYLEALYVIVALIGINTEWFMWVLIGAHVLFVLAHYKHGGESQRLLYLQVLTMILGGYMMSQVVATAGGASSGSRPTLVIIREFLSFGIVYHDDVWSIPMRVWPWIVLLGIFVLAMVLWWRALGVRVVSPEPPDVGTPLAWRPLCLAALGMTLVMASIAALATPFASKLKVLALTGMAVFPVLVLIALPVATWIGPQLRSRLDSWQRRFPFAERLMSPMVFMALVPFLMICVAAYIRPIVDRQALIMFVPYVLIVLAAGTSEVARRRILRVPLTALLAALFAASVWHFHRMPQSPRDFATLAQRIEPRLEANDLIFVQPGKWYATPLFYYLDQSRLVARDYGSYAARPNTRIWVILFSHEPQPPAKMAEALTDYRPTDRVDSLRSSAILYERR